MHGLARTDIGHFSTSGRATTNTITLRCKEKSLGKNIGKGKGALRFRLESYARVVSIMR
jgi:hypothetical protein